MHSLCNTVKFTFLTPGQESYASSLTPAELLIALHNMDTTKVDMKTVIKGTTVIQW